MSQQDKKNYGERARQEEGDYDLYLYWPSLNRDVSSRDPASPLYGPISLHSESTDYESSLFGSRPPSPITFAPVVDRRFPLPVEKGLDFGFVPAEPSEAPHTEAQVQQKNVPAKHSPIVKMGMFLSQITHCLDHAIEGVKLKLRKPRTSA